MPAWTSLPRREASVSRTVGARLSAATLLTALVSLLTGLSGCQNPLALTLTEDELDRGAFEIIEEVDLPAAPSRSGCGAQALAAVLAFRDPTSTAESVLDEFSWADENSTPITLLLAARDRGNEATLAAGTLDVLKDSVAQGEPVLVMFDSSIHSPVPVLGSATPVFHWGVVTGFAKDRSTILLAAPRRRHYLVPLEIFEERWSRTGRCLVQVSS